MTHYTDIVLYCCRTLDGIAGKLEQAAVRRHLSDLRRTEYKWNWEAAEAVLDFFRLLHHTTGEYAGQPFELRPFQKFLVACMFGWQRPDGTRRFREAFISLARGNGKSPLAAGLGLRLAFFDGEPRAEVYCAATTRDQARLVHDEAKRFVSFSPGMGDMLTVFSHAIVNNANHSAFKPLGSDSKNTDGLIPHGVIEDELHEWRDKHKGLLEKLETSLSKRREPMRIVITTAGTDESTIWDREFDYSEKVVEGIVPADDHFSFICMSDANDDIKDESLWVKANPMLRYPESPVKIAGIRSLAAKCDEMPDAELKLRRYHLNQKTASYRKLITTELWKKGNGELPELAGRPCFTGFDWGWKDDLAALVHVFPLGSVEIDDEAKPTFAILCRAWCPEEGPRELNRAPWKGWIDRGFLVATPGNTTDIDAIYEQMRKDVVDYQIKSLAFDPHNCREFGTRCVNEWGLQTFEHYQSPKKYNEPTRELVNMLHEERIVNGNNPLLAWCASNLVVKEDTQGYVMPAKGKSEDKIDPIVALIMALSEAMFAETQGLISVYDREDRGFVTLGV